MGLKNIIIKEDDKTIWKEKTFIDAVTGIISATENDRYVAFEVGSGSYCFELTGTSNS